MTKDIKNRKTSIIVAASALQLATDITRELLDTGGLSSSVKGEALTSDGVRHLLGSVIHKELVIQKAGK